MQSKNIEQLYNKLGSQLKYFIGKRVNDPMITEDILHDVFIKIHNNIGTVKDESKIESWIYQITRNAIIDYYRINKNHSELEEELIPVEESEEENDSHRNASIGLTEFIQDLPKIYRDAILFTEFEGLTQKQLAERLGISLTGAKSRVQRARIMLKDLLFQCCHFEYDIYGTVIDYCKLCCCCEESKKH
jgi:RNA polymerase sigma-70 factor, ECF subfamily